MTADVDWTRTEWFVDGDEDVEYGDPACDRAMQELFKYRVITIGDYQLRLEDVSE